MIYNDVPFINSRYKVIENTLENRHVVFCRKTVILEEKKIIAHRVFSRHETIRHAFLSSFYSFLTILFLKRLKKKNATFSGVSNQVNLMTPCRVFFCW